MEDGEAQKPMDMSSPVMCNSDCSEEAADIISLNHFVNKRKHPLNITLKLNLNLVKK